MTTVADPVALCMAALAAQESGRTDEAVAGFSAALATAPDALDLRLLLAYAQGTAGNRAGARATLEETPGVPTMTRLDARRLADSACEIHADGVALRAIDRALQFGNSDPDLRANRGGVLHRLGDVAAAAKELDAVLARWPAHATALMNRALLHAECGESLRALTGYNAVLRVQPGHARARSYRGLVRLARGDIGGWEDYEARRTLPSHTVAVPPGIPSWDGRDPAGLTLLLWGEQGLGDQIMGVRFARRLAEHGARVVVRCHRSLVSMLGTAPGVSAAVADDDVLPACDAAVPMFSVPTLLRFNHESQYGRDGYLGFPQGSAERPADMPWHDAPRDLAGFERPTCVGIVWAGSAAHGNDHNRSFPASMLPSLLDVPNVSWLSLQMGPRRADLDTLPAETRGRVMDASEGLRDFSDTARVLSGCDVIVTVDTSVAHLAGALGVRTLTMLPHVADWRWGEGSSESAWYRSVRLVRQPSRGDWASVTRAIRSLLARQEMPTDGTSCL